MPEAKNSLLQERLRLTASSISRPGARLAGSLIDLIEETASNINELERQRKGKSKRAFRPDTGIAGQIRSTAHDLVKGGVIPVEPIIYVLQRAANELDKLENLPAAGAGFSRRSRERVFSLQNTFICGCGHSGTTLIANILAGHEDVYLPLYETGMFLFGAEKAELDLTEHWSKTEQLGKNHFAEKTPRHIYQLDLIRRLVRQPRFILMIRDGRDVAASLAERFGDLQTGIDRWINENNIVLSQWRAHDVFALRYEDFIENPASILRRVCAFMGIDFDDKLLNYHQRERLWFKQTEVRKGSGLEGVEHDALRNWQANQPIFDGRGRWKVKWSAEDMRKLTEGRGRPLMEKFGYLSL